MTRRDSGLGAAPSGPQWLADRPFTRLPPAFVCQGRCPLWQGLGFLRGLPSHRERLAYSVQQKPAKNLHDLNKTQHRGSSCCKHSLAPRETPLEPCGLATCRAATSFRQSETNEGISLWASSNSLKDPELPICPRWRSRHLRRLPSPRDAVVVWEPSK